MAATEKKANRLIVAGITGSYASGKSAVAEEFRKLGAYIIDADVLAREAAALNSEGLKEIRKTFGEEILNPDGSLDRKKMAAIIFNDPNERKKLEEILHPKVRQIFLEKLDKVKAEARNQGLILYIVPLLFESKNRYPELEKIIVVSAPRNECIQRIMKRDGSSRDFAEKKYDSQLDIREKEKRADYVIKNDSTIEQMQGSVKRVFSELTK